MGEGTSGNLFVKLAGIAGDVNMKLREETAAVSYNWSHTDLTECYERPWPWEFNFESKQAEIS